MTTNEPNLVPTALVCGAGAEQGLGAALCRRFAAEGYHVPIAGRTTDKIARMAGAIAADRGSAEPMATDVTSESDVIAVALQRHDLLADVQVDVRQRLDAAAPGIGGRRRVARSGD